MTGRDFSYAYFVSPLRYRTPDKQCGPGRYRGLTAFASLSMAVSVWLHLVQGNTLFSKTSVPVETLFGGKALRLKWAGFLATCT
ncbi:hypothetical protein, partial [Thiolapillus sp.]|uniref:hypothetical protein n=1 Tax=Thiolapillus sp. TaxID=2017437 RepID=UPI003AF5A8F8